MSPQPVAEGLGTHPSMSAHLYHVAPRRTSDRRRVLPRRARRARSGPWLDRDPHGARSAYAEGFGGFSPRAATTRAQRSTRA